MWASFYFTGVFPLFLDNNQDKRNVFACDHIAHCAVKFFCANSQQNRERIKNFRVNKWMVSVWWNCNDKQWRKWQLSADFVRLLDNFLSLYSIDSYCLLKPIKRPHSNGPLISIINSNNKFNSQTFTHIKFVCSFEFVWFR